MLLTAMSQLYVLLAMKSGGAVGTWRHWRRGRRRKFAAVREAEGAQQCNSGRGSCEALLIRANVGTEAETEGGEAVARDHDQRIARSAASTLRLMDQLQEVGLPPAEIQR